MAVSNILELGRQGLAASRQSLQTTTNNIANANTPGYSRQRPVLEAGEQTLMQSVQTGGGVRFKEAIRVHDGFVERQLLQEVGAFGGSRTRANMLRSVQDVLSNDSFRVTDSINEFLAHFVSYR